MRNLDDYTCRVKHVLPKQLQWLWQSAIVMLAVFLFSGADALAQGGPCNAHRWTSGDGWRFSGGQWTVETLSAPSLQPKGIVRCASSAETENGLEAYAKPYNPAEFAIDASLTNCFSQETETFGHTVAGPQVGEDIVWFNFDIRALAGTYQFQIISNDQVGWALYHVDPDAAGPTGTGGTYPPTATGLSGDCTDLVYASCGISGNGWSTITVPAFKKPSNYYLAMWLLDPGTGPGKSTFTNNLIYKSRYGCGGATCTLEKDGADVLTCNSDNTYTVCAKFAGSAGLWHLRDNAAIKASSYTVTTYAANGTTVVSTETSTNLTTDPIAVNLGTLESGAIFATICATYASGNPYSIELVPDGNFTTGNNYVTCTDGGSFSGAGLTNPTVSAGTYGPMCVDAAAVALGGTPTGGVWAGAGVSLVEGVYMFNPATAGVGSHTLTYTYNATNGCSSQATATIVVNGLPASYTLTGGSYCQGSTTAGANVLLSDSETGVNYQLQMQSGLTWVNVESALMAGTGDGISFGIQPAGTYRVMATVVATGCDATFGNATVAESPLPNANAGTDKVLTCAITSIALSGSSTTEGVTFNWVASNGGHIVSGAATATPLVDAAGTYTLTVTNPATGCVNTDVAMVTIENTKPDVNAGLDKRLTCAVTSVMLSGSSATAGVTYMWVASNGGNILSGANTATPTVNAAGTYTLTVTDPANGCSDTDVALVTQDNSMPEVGITSSYDPRYSCEPIAELTGTTNIEGAIFSWTGPGGFTASTAVIEVDVEGEYVLTVTNPSNQCSATAQHRVSFTRQAIADAGPDKLLTCTVTTVMLEGAFATNISGLVYWEARDGGNIVSGGASLNPIVDAPGTYVLYVRGYINSCYTTDTVVVRGDFNRPNISAQGGTLSCENGTLQLMGSSTTEGVTYTWTGPGFTSSQQNPVVSVAGEYTLTVTNRANGCTASRTVTVLPQPVSPEPVIVCYKIDFESVNGFVDAIATDAGMVSVFGRKRNPDGSIAAENHARIFDSQAPTGDDDDLYTTDWGNVLIINQHLGGEPNDNQWGGALIVDFSAFGPVTMTSLKALDIDEYEDWSWVYLYDGAGNELYKVQLKPLGNNSKQTVDLGNTKGVMWMKIELDGTGREFVGSGAIDDIRFCVEEEGEDPCIRLEQTAEIQATAFPMPFSDRTTVEFSSSTDQEYVVQLFDSRGRMIKELKAGKARAGEIIIVDVDGRELPNGMYIAHIVGSNGIKKTVKLINKK